MTEVKSEIKHVDLDDMTFMCPITLDIMIDPVMASDGRFYDRTSIESILNQQNPISPIDQQPINNSLIVSPVFNKWLNKYYDANPCLRPVTEEIILTPYFNKFIVEYVHRYLDIIDKMNDQNKYKSIFMNVDFINFLIDNFPTNKEKNQLQTSFSHSFIHSFIHYVCQYGNVDMIKKIINKEGINLNAESEQKKRPIHIICCAPCITEEQQIEILKLLFTKNVELNVKDNNGKYPIHYVCSEKTKLRGQNQVNAIELFLNKETVDINISDSSGWKPIHYVCYATSNFTDSCQQLYILVQLLSICDIDLEAQTNTGSRIIHFLCSSVCNLDDECRMTALSMLIDKKVSLEATDHGGWRPLHYACSNKNNFSSKYQLEIIKMLLDCNVQLNAQTYDGWTPLHFVCSNKTNLMEIDQYNAIKLLIIKGADVNIRTGDIDMRPIDFVSTLETTNLTENLILETAQLIVNSGMHVKRIKILVE